MSFYQGARDWISPRTPTVAVEIARDRVTAVELSPGIRPELVGHASEKLPEGAVVAGVNSPNVVDEKIVNDVLRSTLDRLPKGSGKIGLVVPDSSAKVSFVRFETVPTEERDLVSLIRWQIRKTVPFKLEEAQVAHVPGMVLEKGGQEFVVAVMRKDIINEYEAACIGAGAQPSIIDLATFNLVNFGIIGSQIDGTEDWLLVHPAAGYGSVAIIRGEDLVFFRHCIRSSEDDLSDLVHQTVMYYEDRLVGTGIRRVLFINQETSQNQGLAETVSSLAESLGVSVDTVGDSTISTRLGVSPPVLTTLAASIGLLLRDRR